MKRLPNHLMLSIVLLSASYGASAAGPGLSAADRIELMRPSLEAASPLARHARVKAPAARPAVRTALVQLAPGASTADIEAMGAGVTMLKCGIAICAIPADKVEAVALLDCVERFELSRTLVPHMSKARTSTGIDKIHAGTDLARPYTGRGVVAGVIDQGIDGNHPNFCDENGDTRFKMLVHIKSITQSGGSDLNIDADYYGTDVSGAKPLADFTSDSPSTFHGSHTLGILGGSYSGNISTSATTTAANPYIGAAPGVDLVASCGDLNDVNIAYGFEQLALYAQYSGKPAVLSLSVGSNLGSHRSGTIMHQVLDYYAQDIPVVISAGNEGDIRLACRKTLTADDKELKTFILPTFTDPDYPDETIRNGQVYVYSDRPITFEAVVYSKSRRRVVTTMVPHPTSGYVYLYGTGVNENEVNPDGAPLINTMEYGSQVVVGYDREPSTGEYMATLDYLTMDNTETNADGNYILGLRVTGEAGARVEAYCDGQLSILDDYDQAGWDDGSTDGTINDMACGDNTIVIGSYNTSDSYPLWTGGEAGFEGRFPTGEITSYSSYATFPDRASLPHVCAPGAVIVSSYNADYINALTDANEKGLSIVASATKNGRTYYWGPSHGTSMATPLAAGAIALWLEANPRLTPADIKEIIAKTSVKDEQVKSGNAAQWGAGKLDAYAGIKEALRMAAGIADVTGNSAGSPLMVRGDGRAFNFFLSGAGRTVAEIWSMDGRLAATAAADTDEVNVDLSAATPGIYIARVNGIHTTRIIVK